MVACFLGKACFSHPTLGASGPRWSPRLLCGQLPFGENADNDREAWAASPNMAMGGPRTIVRELAVPELVKSMGNSLSPPGFVLR